MPVAWMFDSSPLTPLVPISWRLPSNVTGGSRRIWIVRPGSFLFLIRGVCTAVIQGGCLHKTGHRIPEPGQATLHSPVVPVCQPRALAFVTGRIEELEADFLAGNFGRTLLSSVSIVENELDADGNSILQDGFLKMAYNAHSSNIRWGTTVCSMLPMKPWDTKVIPIVFGLIHLCVGQNVRVTWKVPICGATETLAKQMYSSATSDLFGNRNPCQTDRDFGLNSRLLPHR